MTRVIYDLEGCSLRAEGHAGAGTKGEDIVCAALSILNWTLISAAEEFNLHLFLDEKNGISEVWCDPEEKDEERCRFLFDTMAAGYQMLGERFPEHVHFEGGKDG